MTFVHKGRRFVFKHQLVTSLDGDRIGSAGPLQPSTARGLKSSSDENRKRLDEVAGSLAQQQEPAPALTP
jgi:hypothetical protein